jgi:iron complex outermembrane receptor protein
MKRDDFLEILSDSLQIFFAYNTFILYALFGIRKRDETMIKFKSKTIASSFALTAAVLMSGSVLAQQEASGTDAALGGIDEIVVTGLKRDQSFVDVPVSVQVFSEAEIERAGISRPQDFLGLTPNVTFIKSNHAGEAFVNIRGQTSVRQSESAVAVVIDGVQLATQNEFNQDFFDIQQIEVLKGPQGALYGRNAAAGAIVIKTRAPTDEFEARAKLSYGNWNDANTNFAVSGPIVEGKLRFRFSGAVNDSDGPFTNIITGEKPYRSNEKIGRLRLDWMATERLTVDFRLNGSRLTGGAIAANAQGPGIILGGVESPVDTNFAEAPFVTDVPGFNVQEKFSTSVKIDYELDFAEFTSVTAYNKIIDNYGAKLFPYMDINDPRNAAGNAIVFGDQTQKLRVSNSAFTQEFRLTSTGESSLRWQVGAYFLDSKRVFTNEGGYNGSVPLNPDGTPNPGAFGGFNPDPNGSIFANLQPPFDAIFGNTFTRVLNGGGTILRSRGIDGLNTVNPTVAFDETAKGATNYAIFGNVQYDITDDLELSLAARYDIEDRDVDTKTPDVINPFTGLTFNNCARTLNISPDECNDDKTFKQLQPKATLTYKFEGDGSVFASYGRSFKSGGYNAIGTRDFVVTSLQASNGITREEAESLVFLQDTYDKEVADSYEVGFKAQFDDRRIRVSGALFWTDVKNAQQFAFFPAGGIEAVSSIDKVRIKGFEIDANASMTDFLTLFAGFGYVDTEIRQYLAQPTSVGNRSPYTANYNIVAGAQVVQPINDRLDFQARAEYTRTGSMWFDTANTVGTRRDPVDLVNARIGVASERWELALWSRNLFNKKYNAEAIVLATALGVFNPLFKAPTRNYGIEGIVKF